VNYRSISDLNQLISQQLDKVPFTVDLIVGVPRSGLLAANLLALKRNLPLTDVAGLCEGRLLQSGQRGNKFRFENVKYALVIDDSVYSGASINVAKNQIVNAKLPFRVDYATVYIAPGAQEHVDIFFEECSLPRVFEWNIMHHEVIKNACVDIDGVLCRDPFDDENDDGDKYLHFLRTVSPLVVPTGVIKTLVTCRLEKYRNITEEWLTFNGVRYGELIMLDMPDGETRRRWGKHGEYKGEIYRRSSACLFIESNVSQACKIADIAMKPVLAIDVNQMIFPGTKRVIKEVGSRLPTYFRYRFNVLKQGILRRIYPQSY